MNDPGPPAALMGRILLKNKLITPAQWDKCVDAYAADQGRTPMGVIINQKGILPVKAVDAADKKTAELWQKLKVNLKPIAPATPAAPAAARAATAQPAATPAAEPAPADETADGLIPLATDLPDDDAFQRGSEAEWVDHTAPAAASEQHADKDAIDLVADDEKVIDPTTQGQGEKVFSLKDAMGGGKMAASDDAIELVDEPSSGKKISFRVETPPSAVSQSHQDDAIPLEE